MIYALISDHPLVASGVYLIKASGSLCHYVFPYVLLSPSSVPPFPSAQCSLWVSQLLRLNERAVWRAVRPPAVTS